MDYAALRRFAANERRELLAAADEKSAYFGFMRLGALAFADSSALSEIMLASVALRSALFKEKCRQLAGEYGGIFGLEGELPVPPQLLADGGTAAKLLELPREYFDSVFVLGQLHQYYNEPYRSEIAVGLKRSKRLSSDRIAAATQIFTPEWIVRYMIQNTLNRYLREHGYEVSAGELSFGGSTAAGAKRPPEEITLIDPCMGSGNVLLYAFDVFMELYRSCGFDDRTAAEKVLRHNLFGLELDGRACALAETALRLKAAGFGARTVPQVYDFSDIGRQEGSLIKSDELMNCGGRNAIIGQLLSRRYTIIVTNPPYLGKPAMNTELSRFVQKNYGDYSADLFSVFIARCMDMAEEDGFLGFLTPSTWLFLGSYEKLRRRIYSGFQLENMIHFEYSAFDDATVPLCTFTMRKGGGTVGTYLRLADMKGDMDVQRSKVTEALASEDCPYRFEADTAELAELPSAPLAYWLGKAMLRAFHGTPLGELMPVREGLITGDNDRFLRRWYEVSNDKIAFSGSQKKKWYLLNKGGEYRRWYGDREYVVNWENDGAEIKSFRDGKGRLRSRPQGLSYNFRSSVSWSQITSGRFSVRYFDDNFMFNVAGASAFPHGMEELLFILGLLNSKAASELSRVLNPTLNMNPGDIARLPVPADYAPDSLMNGLVDENIEICRADWDSFETSCDFRKHPLI